MKPIPAARQAASVPPTVVAPTAPWTIAAARSRGPTLRASGVKRSSSSSASRAELPVEHADRRRHGVGRRGRAARSEPDRDALARREAVRDERRLERDDGAAAPRARAPTSSEILIGSFTASSLASRRSVPLRRARARARRRGSRPRARRLRRSVDDLGGDAPEARRRRTRASAPRLRIQVASASGPPRTRSSSSFAKTSAGLERLQPRTEALRAEVADRAPGGQVDADPRHQLGRAQRGGVDRGAQEGIAGEVQVRRSRRASPGRARRRGSSGATPRSEAIVRSPSARRARRRCRSARRRRARTRRRRSARARGGEPSGSSARALPTNRAAAPSAATQRRRSPPARLA